MSNMIDEIESLVKKGFVVIGYDDIMEIIYLSEGSIRIKAKNSSFVINPSKKIDEDVVVLTKKPSDYSEFEEKLVIDGPGEYEFSGVSIKGELIEESLSFEFLEDNQKILLLTSPDSIKSLEAEDYTATIFLLGDYSGNIPQVSSGVVIVVGSNIEAGPTVKRTDKINLKKTEEYKGFIVHLRK